MPQVTQLNLSHQELTEMAIQKQGFTEGHWELQIAFAVTGSALELNGGPSLPSVVIQVTGASLVRMASPTKTSVDAATLFPMEIEVG